MHTLRNFTKPFLIYATIDKGVSLPAENENKAIQRRFVERFECSLRARGESVDGALLRLRASGFVLNKSTLNRWKRGLLPNFNSFQFIVLSQYVGKSFAEMVAE